MTPESLHQTIEYIRRIDDANEAAEQRYLLVQEVLREIANGAEDPEILALLALELDDTQEGN